MGRELARPDSVGIVPSATSIALDALGRIYATSNGGGALLRMNADGSDSVTLRSSLSAPFGLAFGHGLLCATDAYLVAGNGQLFRYENDTQGADVSWH